MLPKIGSFSKDATVVTLKYENQYDKMGLIFHENSYSLVVATQVPILRSIRYPNLLGVL